jgi:hypothetical protein
MRVTLSRDEFIKRWNEEGREKRDLPGDRAESH